jgi:ABC-type glycerol-3-phosphate transport system substrate-binding protein
MKRSLVLVAMLAAAGVLSACSEKPQTITSGIAQDSAAFQGTGTPFAVSGWKQGDKTSWEQQLKTRTQNGQNDYTKVN